MKRMGKTAKYAILTSVAFLCLFIFSRVAFADDEITITSPTNIPTVDGCRQITVASNVASVTVEGKVINATSFAWSIGDSDLTPEEIKALDASHKKNTVGDANKGFSVNVDLSSSNEVMLCLYALTGEETPDDDTDDSILFVEHIRVVREVPQLKLNGLTNNAKTVNYYDFNGSVKVGYSVDNYSSMGLKVYYTASSWTEAEAKTNLKNVGTSASSSGTLTINGITSLSAEGTEGTVYLYKVENNTCALYDVKPLIIKRTTINGLDTTNGFTLADNNGNTVRNLTIDKGDSSVNGRIKVSVDSKYYYKVIVKGVDTDYYKEISFNDNDWKDNDGNYARFKIEGLNGMDNSGHSYTATIQYGVWDNNSYSFYWYDLGKKIDFKVLYKKPELTWENDSYNSGTISFPVYDDLKATITTCSNTDKLVWNTNSTALTGNALKNWAKASTTKNYELRSAGHRVCNVTIAKEDLPKTDTTIHVYLRVNPDTDTEEIHKLGDYTVRYAELVNTYGVYGGNANYRDPEDRVFNISGTDYYFCDCTTTETSAATIKKGSGTIFGFYENGVAEDVIWTFTEPADSDELLDWAKGETTNVYSTTPVSGRVEGQYINNYEVSFNNIVFAEDDPTATVYIYTRRNVTGASNPTVNDIEVRALGSVVIKPAQDPQIKSINTTIDIREEIDYNWFGRRTKKIKKDVTIDYSVIDMNTGIHSIIATYNKEDGSGTQTVYLYYSDRNNPNYNPNELMERTGEVIGLSGNEEESLKLIVENFNGRKTEYDKVYINNPTLAVEAVNEEVTIPVRDREYASRAKDGKFTITVKKDSVSDINVSTSQVTKLKSTVISVNGFNINRTYTETKEEDTFTLNLADTSIPVADNGVYNIRIVTTNDLNNTSKYEFKFFVDTSAPVVTKYEINGEEVTPNENVRYALMYNNDVRIKVFANDSKTGIKQIKYYWKDEKGVKSDEQIVDVEDNAANAEVYATRNQSFRGFLYAVAIDVVGNESEELMMPRGVIIDMPSTHSQETHIEINMGSDAGKDKNGNYLYNKATTFSVKVSDMYSGIEEVHWEVIFPDGSNGNNSSGDMSINLEGEMSGDNWSKVSSDYNIVTAVSRQITVDGNANDIVLKVRMKDRAGNRSEKEVKFGIDKVKPSVSVTYGNEKGDPDFTNYYSTSRTATIVVKERNFNADSANSIIHNSVGNKGTLSSWKENKDANNPDNTTYTATVTFEKDDRYALTFKCSDLAKNSSDEVTSPEFVIDKVNPELTITFDYASGKNNYYSSPRKATVSVKDVNFDPKRLTLAGVKEGGYTVSAWTRKDNVSTATITFDKDGEYAFDASVKDKAGNSGNVVHVSKFTVDQISPKVEIEGIKNKGAYKDTVTPKIVFTDKYIEKESIQFELIGVKNGKINLEGKYTVSEDGLTYLFKDIEKKKENDDLYTLRITVRDMAGNVTKEEITFSVNRFGSYYVFGDKLKNINDKYVNKVEGIEITEINVDKIKNRKVTLSINGVPKSLVEGTDFKVVAEEKDADWKQYKYIFKDSLFEKDGTYIISITSEDEAGNKNTSDNEDKESEIKFGVDATIPIIAAVNFEPNSYYASNGMDFVISVKDNLLLGSVSVFVNGKPVDVIEEEEIFTFHVDESNRRQSVKVVATDMAGNETIQSFEGLLVAGNIFMRLIHNPIALIAIAGVLVVSGAGAGVFLIFRGRFR